jgi:uncharacterized protein YodC (DUF2158 family)
MSYNQEDTVQLKLGGPTMTINKVDGSQLYCSYIDAHDKLQKVAVKAKQVKLIERKIKKGMLSKIASLLK